MSRLDNRQAHHRLASVSALRTARPVPFWLDDVAAPDPAPRLIGTHTADLAVIGGGYSGLWTALLARVADPGRRVVLLEAATTGSGASGRNGGFCQASITHGIANGIARFGSDYPQLEALSAASFKSMLAAVEHHGIDCELERTGVLDVATAPYQVPELYEAATTAERLGHDVVLLDEPAVRAEVASPTYHAGLWSRDDAAMVHPAKLVLGLRAAALLAGVECFEHTAVLSLHPGERRGGVVVGTAYGEVRASRVALCTNAWTDLLPRLSRYILPIYDYVLMTEPLSSSQRRSLAWEHRQGVSDSANQFHYYRLTKDDRILFGGYDAVYHFNNGLRSELEQRPATFLRLAEHFFATFPQLEGVAFSHCWGGAIDTCSRFAPMFGTAFHGQLAYAVGYTGLGVGATHFGAEVLLDLLDGVENERTRCALVATRPVPFPPEPVRLATVKLTQWSLSRADRHEGRRNLWLRALDRAGVGFDS